MTKVIDVQPGDRWTKYDTNTIAQYRDGDDRSVTTKHVGGWGRARRFEQETDLPTPEAHAQLREWGYEVRGEEANPNHVGHYSHATNDQRVVELIRTHSLTESRVREILAQEIDAKITPILVKVTALLCAYTPNATTAKPTTTPSAKPRIDLRDGDTWREFGGTLVQVRGGMCRNCEPTEVGEWFDAVNMRNRPEVLSATAICRLAAMGYSFDDQKMYAGSSAKPTPGEVAEAVRIANDPKTVWHDAAPEPDWRGLLAAVVKVADDADGNSGFSAASAWTKFWYSPALASARTNLAAKAGK